jgi:hypothetical protein
LPDNSDTSAPIPIIQIESVLHNRAWLGIITDGISHALGREDTRTWWPTLAKDCGLHQPCGSMPHSLDLPLNWVPPIGGNGKTLPTHPNHEILCPLWSALSHTSSAASKKPVIWPEAMGRQISKTLQAETKWNERRRQ